MTWQKGPAEWIDQDRALISVAFTWQLPAAYSRACWLKAQGYDVLAGGPAVALLPTFLAGVCSTGADLGPVIQRHNSEATYTSRGCIRACSFCAVPIIEGSFRELPQWLVRPIVCDNNLLACSRAHFDKVIDGQKQLQWTDFNQGLDCRLLTKYHAQRLAELNCKVRLAFDHSKEERALAAALQLLHEAGMTGRDTITVYVLIGYKDTPEDALHRLTTVRQLGHDPFPMRYQPLTALTKNAHVDPAWTARELGLYMRYWSRLRYFRAIPFDQFCDQPLPLLPQGQGQMTLGV